MRAIICGGGTAGHITPGIAIADYIKAHAKNSEILFIGRKDGSENRFINNKGYEISSLDVSGFNRSSLTKSISSATKAILGLKKASELIKRFRPDIVIGTGGYVCWPVIKSAQLMRIPTVIHESNAYPGLTTRTLAKGCTKVLLNYQECKKHLKRQDNIITVGNPIRGEFSVLTRDEARRRLHLSPLDVFVLSFGGSGGSDIINRTVLSVMKDTSRTNKRIRHIHATGNKYYETVKKSHQSLTERSSRCHIVPFINDMPTHMLASDIVIARAGAMTLSEISMCGVASILIPSPNVTDDHQTKNAQALERIGAAILLPEYDLTPERLEGEIMGLIDDKARREKIGRIARSTFIADSTDRIYRIICNTLEKQ